MRINLFQEIQMCYVWKEIQVWCRTRETS